MDRAAWWATVHGVEKESGVTEQLNNNYYYYRSSLPEAPG